MSVARWHECYAGSGANVADEYEYEVNKAEKGLDLWMRWMLGELMTGIGGRGEYDSACKEVNVKR